jgi:metallophosphoesterase (TIGR00282 family)
MPSERILFIGDICGEAGRQVVTVMIPKIVEREKISFVIANGENSAGGYGLTPQLLGELFTAGIDCVTLGDHFFDKKGLKPSLETDPRLLRPLNFPPGVVGRGAAVFTKNGVKVGVMSLVGRVFMKPMDCPFRRSLESLAELYKETRVIIVDFHAEATAEKVALGWFLDGKVSAVLGTHTHIPTADEVILPLGTAYITDVGMSGSFDSVIGMRKEQAIERFLYQISLRLEPALEDRRLSGVVVEVDTDTGKALSIQRTQYRWEEIVP